MAALQGVKIGDHHTLKDWGLYLVVGGTTVGRQNQTKVFWSKCLSATAF